METPPKVGRRLSPLALTLMLGDASWPVVQGPK